MPPRLRQHLHTTVGGGGGGTITPTVSWGPDYGDPDSGVVTPEATMDSVALEGEATADNEIVLGPFGIESSLSQPSTMAMDVAVELDGATGASMDGGELDAVYDPVDLAGTAFVDALAIEGDAPAGGSLNLTDMGISSSEATSAGGITTEIALTLLATKDTYVFNTAGCLVDNANHDGEDLIVDGVLTSRKDSYMGWDLSGLPSGATVLEASLTVKFTGVGLALDTGDIQHLEDADEGWAEGSITCSTAPEPSGVVQTMVFPLGATDQTTVLNATARSRIAARMGAGVYSIVITPPATNVITRTMESKDEGTNNNLGPRLYIRFST